MHDELLRAVATYLILQDIVFLHEALLGFRWVQLRDMLGHFDAELSRSF